MRRSLNLFSAILLITGTYMFTRPQDIGANLPLFYAGFLVASAGFIGLLVHGLPSKRKGWILSFCLLVACTRILALHLHPSDDLARYVWEGRILLDGHNPYSIPPKDPRLFGYRDDVYSVINHKEMPAIYPPFALYLFAGLSKITASLAGFRLFMLLFELAAIAVMFQWIMALKVPRERIIIYALNPLVIVSIAGHGHLDSIQIFLLILGLYLNATGHKNLGMVSVTFAGLTKFLALFALPFLVTKRTVKFLPVCLLIIIINYLPFFFLEEPFSLGNLGVYVGKLEYYSLTFAPLRWIFGIQGAHLTTAIVLSVALIGLWLTRSRPEQGIAPFLLLVTLMNTTIHFWYLAPILALGTVWRSRALVGLSILFLPYFDVFGPFTREGVWVGAWWRQAVTYFPFLIFLWLELSGRWPQASRRRSPSLGIVIPVLNDREALLKLLESLPRTGIDRESVVVADAGSEDGSAEIAESWGARLVRGSRRGRGNQIVEGVRELETELVLILHCDNSIPANLLTTIQSVATAYPGYAGGACRLAYSRPGVSMKILSILSNAKTALFGLSFGDQGQWFWRRAVSVPDIALMEDVELAMRINDAGGAVWVPAVLEVSSRRYDEMGILRGARSVIEFTFGYLLRRRWKELVPDTSALYEKYYRSRK
ncbi:MAG: glycosyltransferase [Candidatus Glassbacteria bacterium]